MSIEIIQISDLHYAVDNGNIILDKILKIKELCATKDMSTKLLIFAICGDITQSGKKEEYEEVFLAFEELIESIKKEYPNILINIVSVPGNHDCNHEIESSMIDSIGKNLSNTPDAAIINFFQKRQEAYFEIFEPSCLDGEKSCWMKNIKTPDDYELNFFCFNTSVLLRKSNNKGTLFFPISSITDNLKCSNEGLNIAMLHHPLSWFDSEVSDCLKDFFDERCHIVMSGHEHKMDNYKKITKESDTIYLEAHVFQDVNYERDTQLNVIYIKQSSDGSAVMESYIYRWSGKKENYVEDEEKNNVLKIENYKKTRDYVISDYFNIWLNKLEIELKHPRKEDICIEDIFVYPILGFIDHDKISQKVDSSSIDAKNIIDDNGNIKKYIIYGDQYSGKTLLAKMFFKEFLVRKKVPLYIDCRDVKSKNILDVINKSFISQYHIRLSDEFLRIEKKDRVLILDNFDKLLRNKTDRNKILEEIINCTDKLYIFADETLSIENSFDAEMLKISAESLIQCKILEYGHKKRSELIKKWHDLELSEKSPNSYEYELLGIEENIKTVLGKSLVPRYPLYISFFLQALDSTKISQPQVGTYGALYELVIQQQLARYVNHNFTLQTLSNYLSELAFLMHKKGIFKIHEKELRLFNSEFNEIYATDYDFNKILNILLKTNILKLIDCDNSVYYQFQFEYIFYYFTAKFISRNLNDTLIQEEVKRLCQKFYFYKHVNVWLFLTHLSSDKFIIDTIVSHANSILVEYNILKFEDDIEFIQFLQYEKIEAKVDDSLSYQENKNKRLEAADHRDSMLSNSENEHLAEDIPEDQNNPVQIITMAQKTIEILGQLLRNFTGTLKAEEKVILLIVTYNLGLRLIEFIMASFRENSQEFIEFLSGKLSVNIEDRNDKKKKIATLIFSILRMHSFHTLHKVALAVGHPQLMKPYEMVYKKLPKNNAYILIHSFVKLNADKDILSFIERSDKARLYNSFFCANILKHEIAYFCYMYPVKSATKQSICSIYGINYQNLRLLESKNK